MKTMKTKGSLAEPRENSPRSLKLVNSVHDGIITIDESAHIRGWNAAATKLFGYAAEEIIGQHVRIVIPLLATYLYPEKIHQHATHSSPLELHETEMTGIHRSGKILALAVTAHAFLSDKHESFITSVVRDIREWEQLEDEQYESEQRFRATFDQAAVGIAHVKLDGSFLRMNQRFCDITGYGQDELTSMSFQDITHPDDLSMDLDYLTQLIAGNIDTYTMDKRYITKSQATVWVNLTVSLVRNQDGSPKYLISVVQDISARKEAESTLNRLRDELELRVAQRTKSLEDEIAQRKRIQEALQRREADLRLITKIIPTPVLYIDNQMRYRFCNEACTRWLRLPADAVIGRKLQDMPQTGFYESIAPYAHKILQTGSPVSFEGKVAFPDKTRYVHGEMLPDKDENGTIRGFVVLATDMTSQHKMQEELRRAKETADAASQAKSIFLATVSHEIRTPIGVMIGYAEELLKAAVNESDRMRLAETIFRNGQNLLAIINDILDLSKVEVGKLEIEKSVFSLPNFMADLISQMRIKASEKGLSLTWVLEDPIPISIETDMSRLRQILFNLIGNAIKFTTTGTVTVRVQIPPSEPRRRLQFLVSDTGHGIDEKNQGRLFQPFTQADSSVARKHGGTGLGLSLSRQLARLLGGDVSLVHSRLHEGSTFVVEIDAGLLDDSTFVSSLNPANIEHQRSEMDRLRRATKVDLSGMHILIVEDFEDNQLLLRAILEDALAQVDLAENGQQGFEMAMTSQYDAILMDMQMPVRDGYWATRELRSHGFSKPIIALTAHAMLGEKERCLHIGCTDFLTKPVDRTALLHTLKNPAQNPVAPTTNQSIANSATAATGPLHSIFRDQPVVARILPIFIRKLPEKMTALQSMFDAADFDGVRRMAHQLKGAGGTYGFPDITHYAQKIEQARGDEEMAAGMGDLRRLCARIIEGLPPTVPPSTERGP